MAPAQQHAAVEVSASSTPSEIVGAVVASATPQRSASNPNKWLILGFFFLVIFASIIYFREEIYTFTKDIHKHPILSSVEAWQVRKYLGSQWTFGTGEDAVKNLEDDMALAQALEWPSTPPPAARRLL